MSRARLHGIACELWLEGLELRPHCNIGGWQPEPKTWQFRLLRHHPGSAQAA